MASVNTDKYVLQELKAPFSGEAAAQYARFAKRILWIDEEVVPGAFQMNCSWYFKANLHSPPPHTHDVKKFSGFSAATRMTLITFTAKLKYTWVTGNITLTVLLWFISPPV